MSAPISPEFERSKFTAAQGVAVEPDSNIWVTASAGTGKTHVLTARVLRLLFDGVAPESILCVTFTKAGAAEMAERIFSRLALFIRASDAQISDELNALGHRAPRDPEHIARARTLFARTLEAPGGLRIQTIHGFCQSLLGRFPLEADLAPGFTTLDERTASGLSRAALESEIAHAHRISDSQFLRDFGVLALQLDEGKLQTQLSAISSAFAKLDDTISLASIEPRVRRALNIGLSETPTTILDEFLADALDLDEVRAIGQAWARGGKTVGIRAGLLLAWVARPGIGNIEDLKRSFIKLDGEIFSEQKLSDKKATDFDPDNRERAAAMAVVVKQLLDRLAALQVAETGAAILRVAWRVADVMARTKASLGLVSYDDLIQRCVMLLGSGAGDWVRYKLDAKITHVLVDEAQDTNAAQWSIFKSLTDDFFAGSSAQDKMRSIFAVGDFKQAIYRFQGSDPKTFIAAKNYFRAKAADPEKPLIPVALATSFRSAPGVIDFVNMALAQLTENALGHGAALDVHSTSRIGHGGKIMLWPRVGIEKIADDDMNEESADTLAAEMVAAPTEKPERILAARIANQISAWVSPSSTTRINGRPIVPGDIMVLVQKRGILPSALVADLKAANVAVAGIDRLTLIEQLAVQDLLACIRFALLPEDDLTLACVLKSPFINWNDADLFSLAAPRGHGVSLWAALRDDPSEKSTAALDFLNTLRTAADFSTPYDFLADILQSGGRAQLFARLGPECDDPVETLLDLALKFETEHAPSLQAFVAWIEADTGDIKREAETRRNEVRIMTVHGAKGLQAKIVILADAHGLPSERQSIIWPGDGAAMMPLWLARKITITGPVEAAQAQELALAQEDYWRLFYVAITRAEDWLCVAGWHPLRASKTPALSWHDVAAEALGALEAETVTETLWGDTLCLSRARTAPDEAAPIQPAERRQVLVIPAWAHTPAPFEPIPPRPLAASQLGGDDTAAADSPQAHATPAMLAARARGVAVHRLLELLPMIAPPQRSARARGWLVARGIAPEDVDALAAQVCGVLADPAFADLFGPDALTEVPITAVLGKAVLSGQIDRLVVRASSVLIVDYKTSRTVPRASADVPLAILRQMAAYRLALQKIYPERSVECLLLWTSTPQLMPLTDTLLDEIAASFVL
jgi:ATP-dependent helicase/nuclease subunit A